MPKLKYLCVSGPCLRFCAIDLQICFLALTIVSKKISKTICETCTKWFRFGTVSETWGLAKKWEIINCSSIFEITSKCVLICRGWFLAVKAILVYAGYLFTCEIKAFKTLYSIFKQQSESNRFAAVSFNKFDYLRSKKSMNIFPMLQDELHLQGLNHIQNFY